MHDQLLRPVGIKGCFGAANGRTATTARAAEVGVEIIGETPRPIVTLGRNATVDVPDRVELQTVQSWPVS